MNARAPQVMMTRPAHQGEPLRALLEGVGARVSHFPTIEIVDRADATDNLDKARGIDRYRLLIFISRNAVDYGARLADLAGLDRGRLPPSAAIGRGTAEYLTAQGFDVAAFPERPSSEDLLETDAVKGLPSGARVLIFRGRGGKEVLAERLRSRGLTVDYAEVYQRIKPPGKSLDLAAASPDLILVGSRDSLDNLYEMTPSGDRARLVRTTLVLGAASMVARHAELGFVAPPVTADSPLDADMVEAAMRYIKKSESH